MDNITQRVFCYFPQLSRAILMSLRPYLYFPPKAHKGSLIGLIKITIFVLTLLNPLVIFAGTLGDIDGDGKVGLPEAVYALQVASGTRTAIISPCEITIASGYSETDSTNISKIIMSVPSDKIFVLTDIVGHLSLVGTRVHRFEILENETPKFKMVFDWPGGSPYDVNPKSLHFNSGISFASGTNIVIRSLDKTYGAILISGYEIKIN